MVIQEVIVTELFLILTEIVRLEITITLQEREELQQIFQLEIQERALPITIQPPLEIILIHLQEIAIIRHLRHEMIITIILLQEVQVPLDLIRLHLAEVDVQVEEAAAVEVVVAVDEDKFKSFYSTRVLTVMLGAWVFF